MNKKRNTIAGVIVILLIAVFVVGFFVVLNQKNGDTPAEVTTVSEVDRVLLRDMSRDYPPTPKEVLKYYSDITTCFYSENLEEENLKALAVKARELYDEELRADKTEEEYLEDLKNDILEFNSQGIVVSGYSLSASTDVEFFTDDGYEFARLYANYRLRQGTEYAYVNEVFLLRKDDAGHWKIYGWDMAEETVTDETGETFDGGETAGE